MCSEFERGAINGHPSPPLQSTSFGVPSTFFSFFGYVQYLADRIIVFASVCYYIYYSLCSVRIYSNCVMRRVGFEPRQLFIFYTYASCRVANFPNCGAPPTPKTVRFFSVCLFCFYLRYI
eukprot:GEMP01078772.1.p1 GENE.GEMP01078772.1~~GEMP01078772.1.p1  ORF type:complete len:120 (+),score=1.98 GEMP01078772.1:96-455(+)